MFIFSRYLRKASASCCGVQHQTVWSEQTGSTQTNKIDYEITTIKGNNIAV